MLFRSKLWFYTYPSEKMNNLTLEDCTFYGKNAAGEIIPVSYSSISGLNNNQNETNDNYIFWSKKENANVKKGIHTKVDLGSFEKGNNIGFVFRGTSERCQFTTPSLNISSDTHSYINKSFNYRDKSGSFTPTQNVSNGFMCHIIDPEFELNILGMENRSTNHNSYDGDYNDMICIVETNPIALRPAEEVIPSDLDEYVLEKGLYLFEDNYPYAGDFDFNDVVIEYEIFSYINNSAEKGKKANVKLLAYGSAFTNEFGFKSGEEYIPLFTGIMGKENVHNEVTEILDEKTQTFSNAELKPYLHNGRGYILDSNYNTGEYPYVLIIPSTNNASSEFCWCKESKKISDAHDFDYPRAADWYLTPINKDLVITRK